MRASDFLPSHAFFYAFFSKLSTFPFHFDFDLFALRPLVRIYQLFFFPAFNIWYGIFALHFSQCFSFWSQYLSHAIQIMGYMCCILLFFLSTWSQYQTVVIWFCTRLYLVIYKCRSMSARI